MTPMFGKLSLQARRSSSKSSLYCSPPSSSIASSEGPLPKINRARLQPQHGRDSAPPEQSMRSPGLGRRRTPPGISPITATSEHHCQPWRRITMFQ